MRKPLLVLFLFFPLAQTRALTPNTNPLVFFEPNAGQFEGGRFRLVDAKRQLVIHETGFELYFSQSSGTPASTGAVGSGVSRSRLSFHFVNAGKAEAFGEAPMGFTSSYLLSANPQDWIHNVPAYGRVRLTGLYTGVDAVFYVRNGHVAYDLLLAKGSDLKQVALEVAGASRVWSDEKGLHIETPGGELLHTPPKAWQLGPRGLKQVEISYRVEGNHVFFFRERVGFQF